MNNEDFLIIALLTISIWVWFIAIAKAIRENAISLLNIAIPYLTTSILIWLFI